MKNIIFAFLTASTAMAFGALNLLPLPQSAEETGGAWSSSGTAIPEAAIRETRDASIPAEGYRLTVTSSGVSIVAADDAGAFYARKTLDQLLQIDAKGNKVTVPCVKITDQPAYRWRGVLLDEGRHFFGKETVRRLLDRMADYKFNVFHWHLTEDQGWRLDVPGLPELAKRASLRPRSPALGSTLKKVAPHDYRSSAHNTMPYGPFFYTAADLKEIVAYAAERHIQVVPEIELPGHSRAVLGAYPNLCCFPEQITSRMASDDWGIFKEVLCVGNDDTIKFLEQVLDYVCEIFPSPVIHIGGDECPRVNWEKCPKCQARMKAEGLAKPGELQTWLTRHVADYLAQKGRRIMGWDEILAGGVVPKTAIGQSWRINAKEGAGTDHVSGASGAENGYDIVMSPHTLTYYSYRQGLAEDPFVRTGGTLPLKKAYTFDPAAGFSDAARKHILGGQCCMWSEYLWNDYDLAWRMWPRAFAMAEILWSAPKNRDFTEFSSRAAVHRKRLIKLSFNCAPLE